jgi:starch-binding outer membrane protein, SusD/RagB family
MNIIIKCTLGKEKRFVLPIFFLLLIMMLGACKKLVEAPPPSDQVSEINVFSTDATAIGALSDIYNKMNDISYGAPFQGGSSISILTGLSSDEMTLYSGVSGFMKNYYTNSLSQSLVVGHELWAPLYNFIYKCNAAIKGLNASTTLTPVVKQQLLGEAKFMRAYCYFNLVNLFGDVPLALSIEANVNTLLTRSPKADVYQQIIIDLLDAEGNLSSNFLNVTMSGTTTERVRPTQWAAKALLARVYLYTGNNYTLAEAKATEVISNTTLFGLTTLNQVFLKNSKEAIWQLQPTNEGFNTMEAYFLIVPEWGPDIYTNTVYLSNNLMNSFELNDSRAKPKNWIDTLTVDGVFYRFPYKYKLNGYDPNIISSTGTQNMKEYFMVFRLAEQYLIRAEARAQQSKLNEAISDLDIIRNRAGLPLIAVTNPGINKTNLLDKILHERQVELFTELGQRWFDLKRTGKVDAVMTVVTPQKSNNATQWQSYQQLFPVSSMELQKAPNLVQTPGYN